MATMRIVPPTDGEAKKEDSAPAAAPAASYGAPVHLGRVRRNKRRTEADQALKLAKQLERRMLREMNRDHALIKDRAKIAFVCLNEDGFPMVNFITKEDMKILHANKPLFVPQIKTDRSGREYVAEWKKTDRVGAWLAHQRRRSVRTISNNPTPWGQEPPADILNVWPGYGMAPMEGYLPRIGGDGVDKDFPVACANILRHLYEVICAGDECLFWWDVAWLAQMVQDPMTLPRSFLLILGGQGTGKGLFLKALSRMLGPSFLTVSQRRHLVGNFNVMLQGKLLVFADEIFVLDAEAKNVLKNKTSEETIAIEPKGKDPYEVKNTSRVIMATNEKHAWDAEIDDRRSGAHRCSEHRKVPRNAPADHPNRLYFDALSREIDGDGPAALFRYLLDFDYSGYRLDTPPVTAALIDQKVRSLPTLAAWWYERLCEGVLAGKDDSHEFAYEAGRPWPTAITKPKLFESFDAYVDRMRLGEFKRPGRAEISRFLTDQKGPVGLARDGGREGTGDRDYTYALPELDEARTRFADWLGTTPDMVPWGAEAEATAAPVEPARPYDGCSDDTNAEDFLGEWEGAPVASTAPRSTPDDCPF